MADLKLIGAVAVKVRPDASGFKESTKRQVLKELAGQEYDVVVNLDLDAQGIKEKAKRIVQQVKREADESVGIKVGVDPDSLRKASADLGKVLEDFKLASVKVEMDRDYLQKAGNQLNAALNAASAAGIKVDVSTADGLGKAKRDIDDFLQEENGRPVKFKTALAGLELAAAQLKYATRDRKVNFFVNVSQKSLAVSEGLFKSLAGLGVLTTVGQRLESLIGDFDKFSLKSAGWATGIAAVANTLAFVGTSAFTVGEGMVQSIGLLAALPTVLAATAAGVLINVAAFKDFKSAIDGDAKALAALPPQARAAAKALQGTWTSIQKPVQAAFWEGMGDSIQRFVATSVPVLRTGLTRAADDVGRFNAGFLDSFDEIARNGSMEKMFGNLEGFFQQATTASKPFADALNILGLRGSDYLPRFGGFLTDIAKGFDDWITKADEAGKINVWIENGVQSLKDMGKVGGSVIDMFKGITRAVNDAGGGGLPEFRDNMRALADVMLAEPFRSRMATIFAGARKGASELNAGVKDLGDTIGSSAVYVNQLLTGLGKLGGGLLSGLAKTLGQLQFQAGTLEGIRDMQTALTDLGPSFEGIGRIVGNMSRVAGEIFKGVSPVINTVVGFLDKSVGKLTGNLEKVAGPLTGLVNALVTAASGPLTMVVDLLNGTLSVFNALPEPIQLAVAGLGTFLALRGPLGGFLGTIQSAWTKVADTFTNGGKVAESAGKRIGDMIYFADGTVKKFDGKPMIRELEGIRAKAGAVGKSIGGSLMAFAGGPWGIALATAGAAITLMGDAAAKQKAKIDDLVTALDGQTGINGATERVIAAQLRAKDSFLWMEKTSVADSAEKIGVGLRDIQQAAEGVPASIDKVNDALKRAYGQRSQMEAFSDTLKTLGNANMLGPLSGLTKFLQFSDGANVGNGLQQVVKDLEAARLEAKKTGEQLGVPINASAGIIAAIDTLVAKASTADEKLRSINDIIRIMEGADGAAADAQQRSNDSARTLRDNLKAIFEAATKDGQALPDLFNETTGQIDTVTKTGSDLRSELKKVAEDGRTSAIALALAQKDPQKAAQVLYDEMTKTRELIAKELEVGKVPPEEIAAIVASLNLDPAKIDMLLNPETRDQALADLTAANQGAKGIFAAPITANLDSDSAKFDVGVAEAEARGKGFTTNTFTSKVDADKSPFERVVSAALGTGTGLAVKTFSPTVDGDKSPFDRAIASVKATGDTLARSSFNPAVNIAGNAVSVLADIVQKLTGLNGKVFTATVDVLSKVLGGSADGSMHNGMNWDRRFQPKFYAKGGIEQHVAQIARPSSTLRVWAEPETGGEAYIPLASSKRARSTAILDDVADRFGYDLVRKAEMYANGGVRGGDSSGGSSIALHIDAAPGVAYHYAREVAAEATTKLRDVQALYDFA
jgi:phage-related protein